MKNLLQTFLVLISLNTSLPASSVLADGVLDRLRAATGVPNLSEGDALTLLLEGNGASLLNSKSINILPPEKARYIQAGERESSILDYYDYKFLELVSMPYPNLYKALKDSNVEGANFWAKEEGFEAPPELYDDFARKRFKVAKEDDLIELFASQVEQHFEQLTKEGMELVHAGLYAAPQFVKNSDGLCPLTDYLSVQKLWKQSKDFDRIPLDWAFKIEYRAMFKNSLTDEIILSDELL